MDEIKHDGYPLILRRDGSTVELRQRRPALCSVAWRSSNTLSTVIMVFSGSPPDHGFGAAPGGLHALANSIAFADFCGAVWRNAGCLGAIADFLSLVFARR